MAERERKKENKESGGMFNTQRLLWKKGALGSIWTAAHSAKRLKKEQVFLTDISSSVGLSLIFSLSFLPSLVL